MKKIIRPTYPIEFSIGVLILIFVFAFFLSHQIFDVRVHDIHETEGLYFGMFLVSSALIIMILIMWEEILFPIRVKEVKGGMIFRNHRNKLKTQAFIYCAIPIIFIFIYLEYEIVLVRFLIWAAVCLLPPVLEKLVSGITNYNDFIMLTTKRIEYRNNHKEGAFDVKDIENVVIIKDERKIIKKLEVQFLNNTTEMIDLDEMELHAFYHAIYKFVLTHYKHTVQETPHS